MIKYVITGEELSALYGRSWLAQLIYLRALRPYMDYATGIIGQTRKISYQSIAEELERDHRRGRHSNCSGQPTMKEIRCALEELEQDLDPDLPPDDRRPALLRRIPADRQLIFEALMALRDSSVSGMRGRRGADPQEPMKGIPETSNDAGSQEMSGRRGADPDMPMRGTHPESGKRINTTTTTTANLKRSKDEQPTADCGGGGEDEKKKPDAQTEQRNMPLVCAVPEALIYPKRLRPPEQQIAGRMVAGLGDQAQQLLDVLAAAIIAGEIRKTPLDYLQGLIRRCQDGTFDPTPGLPIAEQRKPVQTQRQGPSAREKAAERAMDDRLREYERQMQRPRAP